MKVFILTTVAFLSLTTICKADIKDWQRCEADTDCIIVGSHCSVGAANKARATEADAYHNDVNARIDCAENIDPATRTPACRSHVCVAITNVGDRPQDR